MATFPPAVVRFMLDFVDQHKGPNNIYEKDMHGTLASMAKLLNTTYSNSKANQYHSEALRNRLSRFANELTKDQRLKGIRALWRHGSDMLDISRFEEGVYDASEISANGKIDVSGFKMPDVGGWSRTIWTGDKVRVLLDLLDANKGPKGLFMTDRRQALELVRWQLKTADPSTKITADQVENKLTHICDARFQKDGKAVTKAQLCLGGMDILDLTAFPDGTFKEHEIKEWTRQQQQQRPFHLRGARETKSSTPHVSDTDGSDEAEQEDTTPEPIELSESTSSPVEDSTVARTLWPATKMPDTSFIKQAMANLDSTIEAAVLRRLTAAKIDPNQLCDRFEIPMKINQFNTLRATNHLPLQIFIQAMIGAAITSWALRDEIPHPDLGFFVNELRHNVAPDVLALAKTNATRMYYEKKVMPNIKGHAVVHARQLNDILIRFMTPPTIDVMRQVSWGFDTQAPLPGAWNTFYAVANSLQSTRDTHVHPTTPRAGDRREGLRPRNQPQQRIMEEENIDFIGEWHQSLVECFEMALKMRVEMQQVDGIFSFDFPFPMSEHYESRPTGAPKHTTLAQARRKVMLGLLPGVFLRLQNHGGTMGERIPCAPQRSYDIVNGPVEMGAA
ncbi:uncharacterized protein AB675_7698 [Cyphellophora attinorum]|uniref:Uncharacterized protein n=1 Tax=Cyphellophora attinorum TaxID=1664694 RepID=A0A0N1H4L0_9EURO|nr:uncharacterized protein AB675_7698 [Phialophora attinorum]KPI40306.1 hypothetical protein AB675_7698 [Phialophora attinorum]